MADFSKRRKIMPPLTLLSSSSSLSSTSSKITTGEATKAREAAETAEKASKAAKAAEKALKAAEAVLKAVEGTTHAGAAREAVAAAKEAVVISAEVAAAVAAIVATATVAGEVTATAITSSSSLSSSSPSSSSPPSSSFSASSSSSSPLRPSRHLLTNDIIFLVSKMLQGEHALSTLPLLCKATASTRLCLHLGRPIPPGDFHVHNYLHCHWTRESLFYSVPSRHSLLSLQLSERELAHEYEDRNLNWLATSAPHLENLTITAPNGDSWSHKADRKELELQSFSHSLKLLDLNQLFLRDLFTFYELPNLTKVRLHTIKCEEKLILNALWRTPLISLRMNQIKSDDRDRHAAYRQERRNETDALAELSQHDNTPPRFANTLRELACNEDSTVDRLTEYCQQLEDLRCQQPGGLVDVNPYLTALVISFCPCRQVTLNHLLGLRKLTVYFQDGQDGNGTVQGPCPSLEEVEFGHVEPTAAVELLSSSKALTKVLLWDSIVTRGYWEYFVSDHFPKDCKLSWWAPWAMIEPLLAHGVRLNPTYVVDGALAIDSPPPSYGYLTECTTLHLITEEVYPKLLSSMTSLTTIGLNVESMQGLQSLLDLIPSLTVVKVDLFNPPRSRFRLHSQNLQRLMISIPSPSAQYLRHNVDLPRLTSLDVTSRSQRTDWASVFIEQLLSLSSNNHTPSLQSFSFIACAPQPYSNDVPIRPNGHPQLREIVLRTNYERGCLHLQNFPNLRRLEVSDLPNELWLNLPARCDISINTFNIKPSLPRFPQFSGVTMMLIVWRLQAGMKTNCPMCITEKCKHGVIINPRETAMYIEPHGVESVNS